MTPIYTRSFQNWAYNNNILTPIYMELKPLLNSDKTNEIL